MNQTVKAGKGRLVRFEAQKVYSWERSALTKRAGIVLVKK